MSRTPQDVLREAAELIGEHGHTKRKTRDLTTGAFCAMGALQHVALPSPYVEHEYDAGYDAYSSAVIRLTGQVFKEHGMISIPNWNDAPERTAEDVILALKRAAHAE